MAVINDSDDKMRDIIAKHAAELTTDDEGAADDTDLESGDESVVEEPAAAVEEEAPAAEGVVEPAVEKEALVAEGDKGTPDAKGAADAVVIGEKGKGKPAKAEDAFAKEHGLKPTDAIGRVNRIPYPVIRDRIVPNAIKKAQAGWETTVLKPVADKVSLYEKRLGSIEQSEKIQFEQPRRFLAMLSSIPGYTEIFNEMRGGKAGIEEKPVVGTKLATDADDPEPQPDAKDANGKVVGWTEEGLSKARAWDRRQAAKEARETTLAEIDKRFKPMQERFQSVAASEKTATDIDGIIGIAANWPGFSENYASVLEELGKGTDVLDTPQKMYQAVQSAYNSVMFGALGKTKETKEEERARYFEEFQTSLRKAPRSTATRTTVRRDEPADVDENVSPDDRMRAIIVESARKAGHIK